MKRLVPLTDIPAQPRVLWPTEAQQLLLQAALLEAPDAPAAWAKWLELQTDVIDIASWRLLPLAYVNLKRFGVDDALMVQAKELHLFQWRNNQKLFHQAAGFLDELRGLEIPALVLKGVALAHLYYPDSAARAMDDLDVLVPADKFFALCTHLLQNGWTSDDFVSYHKDLAPSVDFKRADGFNVDIHCRLLHANSTDGADNDFWASAQTWSFKQKAALTLAPEDHLLHVISHGMHWCGIPPFRWMADVWWILARTRDNFNWERLLQQARVHEVNLQIFHGLKCLNQIVPLNFPTDLLERLEAIPNSADARIQFILDTHPLPEGFFSKAIGLWNALGKGVPDYSIVGKPATSQGQPTDRSTFFHTFFLFLHAFKMNTRKVFIRIRARIFERPREPVRERTE